MNQSARSVVVTGASRGLGLASAARLHQRGWHVIAAMRSPEAGLEAIRSRIGAGSDDERLSAVKLDLQDHRSIDEAASEITELVGAPYGLVHNAGIVSVGAVEEMPASVVEEIFTTNLFGAVRLTKGLLPAMRARGAGRIVVVSSETGVHGMPSVSAYGASKAALERWAESLAAEIAPFGIGVTVLVAGTFDTDVLDRAHTVAFSQPDGPYGFLDASQVRLEGRIADLARPPEQFAKALCRALEDQAPFARHAVGPDAKALIAGRWMLPTWILQRLISKILRFPSAGGLRDDDARFKRVDDQTGPTPGIEGPAPARATASERSAPSRAARARTSDERTATDE